jgi:hypothetical protein
MRFLVDECTGPSVAAWLREQNEESFSSASMTNARFQKFKCSPASLNITRTVYWIHLL